MARYRRLPRRRLVESALVPLEGDAAAAIASLAGKASISVVLSSHLVRYLLLPWTDRLGSVTEWLDYARHAFASTYGEVAARWHVHLCATGSRQPRLACAVDSALLASLRGSPTVTSIQPYLMSVFNSRRGRMMRGAAWFVLQESERLTIALFSDGAWKLVRSRQTHGDWRAALPELLDREAAAAEKAPEKVFLWAESEVPPTLGRYSVIDVTPTSGAAAGARPASLALL